MTRMDVQILRRKCNDYSSSCREVDELQMSRGITFESRKSSVVEGTVVRCHEGAQFTSMITKGRKLLTYDRVKSGYP